MIVLIGFKLVGVKYFLVMYLESKIRVKTCKFNSNIRCFWFSCDFVSRNGIVLLCKYHPNKDGRDASRRIKPDLMRKERR